MRAVLTYHSIDSSGSPISVSPDEFSAHCRFLAQGRVRVLSLQDLLSTDDSAEPGVAITFDDGFENFASHALPLLSEHALPATLFVVTGRVGLNNAWGDAEQPGIPTLPLLDWEGIGRVNEAGVELGAHTLSHPRLTTCSDTALCEELEHPIETLQKRVGVRPDTLAYPYGDYDDTVVAAARELYGHACTTDLRLVGLNPDPRAIPRLDMFYFRRAGRLESFGTSSFRAYLGLRRTLRSVRSAVLGS